MEPNVITIRRHDDGRYEIESGFPGPASTLFVLREVIATVERASLEAELAGAVVPGAPAVPPAVAARMNGAFPEA